jgi:glycosyltransferase involved in cell wall biosynthesis
MTDDLQPALSDEVELSVVMPAFNAAFTIDEQLRALINQSWDGKWEILVADNGSTDDTAARVMAFATIDRRIRLLDASGRRGAAYARNLAVTNAKGRLIAFCDADDVVGDQWVAAMGDALRVHSFVTGPQEHERLNEPWLHGVYGTRPARELQMFRGVFPFGPTANLGIRRDTFHSIGGFDTGIAVYEDLELCQRAWFAGVELKFVPNISVHYRYRHRVPDLFRQALAYGRAAPDITRRLAERGDAIPSRWRGVRNWLWLFRELPSTRSKAGRARWAVVAGGAVGRLAGSARARYLVL